MTNQPAAIKDTFFYADFDQDTQMWCAFGDNSGKAYSSHMDKSMAEARADELNKYAAFEARMANQSPKVQTFAERVAVNKAITTAAKRPNTVTLNFQERVALQRKLARMANKG